MCMCMCMCMVHVHVHVHVHVRAHVHVHVRVHVHVTCVCLFGVTIEAAPSCLGRGAPLRRRKVVLFVAARLGMISSR